MRLCQKLLHLSYFVYFGTDIQWFKYVPSHFYPSILKYIYNIYLADDITVDNLEPTPVYSVVKNDSDNLILNLNEINELMKISNEYFDIRHNEYLNKFNVSCIAFSSYILNILVYLLCYNIITKPFY